MINELLARCILMVGLGLDLFLFHCQSVDNEIDRIQNNQAALSKIFRHTMVKLELNIPHFKDVST